jgi:hypothetical protein
MEALVNKALWKFIHRYQLISDKLICLDISRAFDRVWHRGLIAKLEAIGTLLKWIEDYLANR